MTVSGTRFGGWYLTAQGVGILAWWVYLWLVPSARSAFVPPGASETELLAFRLPDLLIAAPVSLIAGVAILTRRAWAAPLAWTATGALVYACLYCVSWSLLRQGGWLNVALMAPAAVLCTISALDIGATGLATFTRAKPASPARHVAVTLAQTACFWLLFLVLIPGSIVYVERRLPWSPVPWPSTTGVATLLFVAFSALGLASGVTMARRGSGTPLPFAATNRLVISGPYAYVRNPMVVAGLGQGAAVGLWLGSWAVLAYAGLGGVLWQLLVRPAEERDLQATFGDDFVVYCRQVQCWIPRRPFDVSAEN